MSTVHFGQISLYYSIIETDGGQVQDGSKEDVNSYGREETGAGDRFCRDV